MTSRQRAALEWLPSDGSWRANAGKMSGALASLGLRSGIKLVIHQYSLSGPRGGMQSRYRLTEAGVAFKAIQAKG